MPEYHVEESGPDHAKSFTAVVRLGGEEYGSGSGRSKKEAEQQAAEAAWNRIRNAQNERAAQDGHRTANGRETAQDGREAADPPGRRTGRPPRRGEPERRGRMPELPEVEVVRRGLERWVSGRTVARAEVLHPGRSGGTSPARRSSPPASGAA
nr:hypothetical protein GCM10020093_055440 [Planobispora longispora]